MAAAAAAALAEMPDQGALAAVHAELQAALGVEVALLQQRLSVLGHRAGVLVEEVVQLHGTANSQMAEQLHRRYVEECGAVAALERVTKAAAAAGKPLAKDLRLEVRRVGLGAVVLVWSSTLCVGWLCCDCFACKRGVRINRGRQHPQPLPVACLLSCFCRTSSWW